MKKFPFTLLETVIAIALLGMSLGVLFQLSGTARKRITYAAESWNNTHRLMEAAEYVLLHGDTLESIPERFFPYPDCKVQIQWEDMDDVHEEYTMGAIQGQPELKACTVSILRHPDGKVLESATIDRILYNNALTEEEN